MNQRDERAKQAPPPGCQRCAHCLEWRGTTGERHDCLRGMPMHDGCAWQSVKTVSLISPTK
jgi:hypothetical protein